jgi:hypothetical protein
VKANRLGDQKETFLLIRQPLFILNSTARFGCQKLNGLYLEFLLGFEE